MPGLLENTVTQGYDFLTPYVEKAQPYVEKARNNVPLVDPALKTAEELVPALITRADQLTEPHVEKIRPYVEPRIEQVKEKVAPYVDEGIKQYGLLRQEGANYYNVGLGKIEQVKGYKDAKETQIKEFAEPKIEKIKEFTGTKTAQIREFTDPKVEKIKEFTETKTTQIKEFADPKVEKIKGMMEPTVAVITARKRKMQNLVRVPAALDLQGLNYESLLGKVASALEKAEAIMDRYMPLSEEQKKDNESDFSNASDASCVRINRSVVSMVTRPLSFLTAKSMKVLSYPAQLKSSLTDGTLKLLMKDKVATMKKVIEVRTTSILTQVTDKLAPKVAVVTQASTFKKGMQMAVTGSEKILGKEKTAAILSKVETCTPAAWKAKSAAKSR